MHSAIKKAMFVTIQIAHVNPFRVMVYVGGKSFTVDKRIRLDAN